jgi:hypothetical protein
LRIAQPFIIVFAAIAAWGQTAPDASLLSSLEWRSIGPASTGDCGSLAEAFGERAQTRAYTVQRGTFSLVLCLAKKPTRFCVVGNPFSGHLK